MKDSDPNNDNFSDLPTRNFDDLVHPNIDELLKDVHPNIDELLKDVHPNIDELLRDDRPLASENEPLAPPDPSLTAVDAAKWMKEEVERTDYLDQEHAVWYVKRHFGERFTRTNENGNLAFAPEVLKEFRKLTEHTVVWCKPERYWRKRRPDDSPGREAIY